MGPTTGRGGEEAPGARLTRPAILQHDRLGAGRTVHDLDDLAPGSRFGETRGVVGRFLAVAESSGHAVVQDFEAFIRAHGDESTLTEGFRKARDCPTSTAMSKPARWNTSSRIIAAPGFIAPGFFFAPKT
jgi:hypothetical protein